MDAAMMLNLLNGLNQSKSENSKIDPMSMLGMLNSPRNGESGGGDIMKILESADKNGTMKNMAGIFNMLPNLMNSKPARPPDQSNAESNNTYRYKSQNNQSNGNSQNPQFNQSQNAQSQNNQSQNSQFNQQNNAYQNAQFNQSQNNSQNPQFNQSNNQSQKTKNNSQNSSQNEKQGAIMKNTEYESYNSASGETAYRLSPLRKNAYINQADNPEQSSNRQNQYREQPDQSIYREQSPNKQNQYREQYDQNGYREQSPNKQNQYKEQSAPRESLFPDEKNRAETPASQADLQYINTAPKYKPTRKRNNIRYTGK